MTLIYISTIDLIEILLVLVSLLLYSVVTLFPLLLCGFY